MTADWLRLELHACFALLNARAMRELRPRLDHLIASFPDEPDALCMMGLLLEQEGRLDEGAQHISRAIALNPRHLQYRLQLSRLLTDSDPERAEALLREILDRDAGYEPAIIALSGLLVAMHREEESLSVTDLLSANSVPVMQARIGALKSLDRYDEAIAFGRKLVADNLGNPRVLANFATTLNEAEERGQAEQAARSGLVQNPHSAELWLMLGRALRGQSRYDEAEVAFRRSIKERRDFEAAQADLAQLIWMRTGDAAAACNALEDLAVPGSKSANLQKAAILEAAGNLTGALDQVEAMLKGHPQDRNLLIMGAQLYSSMDSQAALELAMRAATTAPGDPQALTALCQAQLGMGDGKGACAIAEKLVGKTPDNQLALALLATALRLNGDARYREIYDYGLVKTYEIPTPPGWSDGAAYLADLRLSLERLHDLAHHPIGMSLRGGSQTQVNLKRVRKRAIASFFPNLREVIQEYLEVVGNGADAFRRRNKGGFRFSSAWSVRLRPNGFHENHVHPKGWISSAFYVDVPGIDAQDEKRSGWIKFGEPGIATKPQLDAQHFVMPKSGRLVLFPSFMWHGTVPFAGPSHRLTVAFDCLPSAR
jgi:tetratricopeptide (TPR) repeat protein